MHTYRYGFSEAVRARTVSPFSILQVAVSFTPKERDEYERLSDQMARVFKKLKGLCPGLEKREQGAFFGMLNQLAAREDEAARLAQQYLFLAYQRKETVCMAEARISCALHIIRALAPQTKVLIFSERIAQADRVYAALKEQYPGQAGCYHSQTGKPAGQNALEAFRDGRLRILVICRALDEGMDVPEVSVGIVLSGAAVRRQRIQRLGRLLRTRPGKDMACLYYLYVAESQEESAYFSDEEENCRIGRLSYRQAEKVFIHPSYEERAARVLQEMAAASMDTRRQKEIRRCLEEGLVRADWLLTEAQCEERLRQASDIRERNYWICMREMAKQNTPKESPFPLPE